MINQFNRTDQSVFSIVPLTLLLPIIVGIDNIRTYTFKTISELLMNANISSIPGSAGEIKYFVKPGHALTG